MNLRELGLIGAFVAPLIGLGASPAIAQQTLAAPAVYEAVDQFGVDVVSGTVQISSPTISVGDPANGGLSLSASWDATHEGWRYSTLGRLSYIIDKSGACAGLYTVVYMGSSNVFQRDGCGLLTFGRLDGAGSLVEKPDGSYNYIARDGSIAVFSGASPGGASVQTITKLNGEVITYSTGSIKNNLGYELRFTDNGSGTQTVTALNNAVDSCASTGPCTYSVTWPSLTFTTVGNEHRVTDALGRTTRVTLSGSTSGIDMPISVARPTQTTGASVTYAYTYVPGRGTVVTSVNDGVATWTYAYGSYCPSAPNPCVPPDFYELDTTVTAPDTGQTIYHVVWSGIYIWVTPTLQELKLSPSLAWVKNALGQKTVVSQSSVGLLAVQYPEGNSATFDRTDDGLITHVHNVAKPLSGLDDTNIYVAYPDCAVAPVFCRLPTSTTDARGGVTDYTYDAAGNRLTETAPAPAIGAARPQTRYGWEQRYAWYKQNGSSLIIQAASPVWVQVRQSACATAAPSPGCTGTVDEVVTTTAYQTGSASSASNLRPISTTTGNGAGTLLATTAMAYDGPGNVVTVDGPLPGTADTTLNIYDAMRQTIGIIGPDPDGAGGRSFPATKTTFNDDGQPTTVAQGTTTAQTVAAFATFSPLQTATTAYNAQARKILEASAPGTSDATVTQYSYDTSGRPSCVAQRMDPADFASLPASACTITTPVGAFGPDRITQTNYDLAGQATSVVMGYGSGPTITESQTWTPNGKTAIRTDGEGNVSTYAYDGYDRVKSLRFPNASGGGSSTTDYEAYSYDVVGNPVTKRTRAGDTFTTEFDKLNRVTEVSADTTGARAVPKSRFTYDNLGHRLTVCFWVSSACSQTITATWDALGRQTSEAGAIGTVGYGYDLAGRRTSVTWPDAFTVGYAWDLSNQVTAITQASSTLASYTYDNLSRRTGITRQNGVTTAYGYDAASRLKELDHNLASTAFDLALDFSRNPASQLIGRDASTSAYTFTPASGTTNYENNGRNQVTKVNTTTITYEVTNGTLSSGNISNDGTTAYAYDAANRLLSAGTKTYAYDPLDRLYQETATATRRLLYAGDQLIGEYDASGILQTRYVTGPGGDEPLVEYTGTGTGTSRFFVPDERGSIIARTDGAGAIVGGAYTYDEYGVASAAVAGRFQYTGQTRLTGTGLYYYKARVYAPELGRFLQTDPIGYEDGLNFYAYAGNDPANRSDPTGLCNEILDSGGIGCITVSSGPSEMPPLKLSSGVQSALSNLSNTPQMSGPGRPVPIGSDPKALVAEFKWSNANSSLTPAERAALDPARLAKRPFGKVEQAIVEFTLRAVITNPMAMKAHLYENYPDRKTGAQLPQGRVYITYDLPWPTVKTRGPARLITDGMGGYFVTTDHYQSFREISVQKMGGP